MKEEKDPIKETEAEHKHIANRKELRGIKMCSKHTWRKFSENEIACTHCPTINIINPEDMQKYV